MVIGNLRNQLLSISELLLNRSKMERLQELKYNKLEQKLNANVVLSEHKKVVANREYKRKKKNAFLIGGGVGLVLGILLAFL
jgi:NAD(P)H-hydrate repair Nnr-like enzyme with NAD(P)H-hydrate dehydratase domain